MGRSGWLPERCELVVDAVSEGIDIAMGYGGDSEMLK